MCVHVCVRVCMKARERTHEQNALQTNSHLQQEIIGLRSKVGDLEDELSSAQNQHSKQSKVTLLCVVCAYYQHL